MILCKVQFLFFNSSVQSLSRGQFFGTHELQHARPPCPSPTPRVYSNLCPSSQWCHPTISSSVIPFFSCLQSFPASGSLPMSQFSTSGGQSTEASASVLPMNIQDWFPLGWTGLISLQSSGTYVLHENYFYIYSKRWIFLAVIWELNPQKCQYTADISELENLGSWKPPFWRRQKWWKTVLVK